MPSEPSLSFIPFFFLFIWLYNLKSFIFKFTNSFFCLNFPVQLLFSAKISIWFFFMFFLCWNSHFVYNFFPMIHWPSLWWLFWILLGNSCIFMSLGSISGTWSCSSVWGMFPCFFIFLDFLCWYSHVKKTHQQFLQV